MAIVYLTAASLGENGGWTRVGALGDVDTINSNDGSTSYFSVLNSSNAQYNLFWQMTQMPRATAFTSVKQQAYVGRSLINAGNWRFRHKAGGTTYNSEGVTNRTFPASFSNHTSNATTYGPGGGWSTDNVNGTIFGVTNWNDGSAGLYGYITWHRVNVDYTADTTYFMPLFFNGLVGALVIPEMIQGVVRFLHSKLTRSIVTYTREELEQVKEEIRLAQRGYVFI